MKKEMMLDFGTYFTFKVGEVEVTVLAQKGIGSVILVDLTSKSKVTIEPDVLVEEITEWTESSTEDVETTTRRHRRATVKLTRETSE